MIQHQTVTLDITWDTEADPYPPSLWPWNQIVDDADVEVVSSEEPSNYTDHDALARYNASLPATPSRAILGHEGHSTDWCTAGAPGFGSSLYCFTCGATLWSDIQILTEADVI